MKDQLLFYGIIFLVCSTACVNKNALPKGVLDQNRMKGILLDMQIADNYVLQTAQNYTNQARTDSQLKVYYHQILVLHHTSRQQFMDSYRYYEAHPDKMKEIFDLMIKDLQDRKAKLDSVLQIKGRSAPPY